MQWTFWLGQQTGLLYTSPLSISQKPAAQFCPETSCCFNHHKTKVWETGPASLSGTSVPLARCSARLNCSQYSLQVTRALSMDHSIFSGVGSAWHGLQSLSTLLTLQDSAPPLPPPRSFPWVPSKARWSTFTMRYHHALWCSVFSCLGCESKNELEVLMTLKGLD